MYWLLFLLGAATIFLLCGICAVWRRAWKECRIRQLKIEMLESSYESLLEMYEKKSVLVHDSKNHMRAVAKLVEEGQEEEALAYLSQLAGLMRESRSIVRTNHKMLDSVLNMKLQEAQEAQIEIRCVYDDMRNLKLTLVEVCALFTNLLDNAIESNNRCPAGEQRKMDVACRRRGNMLVVSVSNPVCVEAVQETEVFFKTAKEDKDMHGFGMLSIRKVLENHDGYMKTDVRDGIFHIVIYLTGF